MNRGLSIWLDALRACAALAVLFGHMAHVRFTRGDYFFLREINIASDAVVVFFVISGLVIAYAAGRDGSPARFAFNRVTRLMTVLVPALILTVAFDAIGTRIDISAYPAPYYEPAGLLDFLTRGLTLSTEWVGLFDRVRLGTNGPLWSLSYEAAYYILFGVAVFARGFIRIALLLIPSIVVGLPILALLPVWLLGVLVWRHVSSDSSVSISPGWAMWFAFGGPAALILGRVLELPSFLTGFTVKALAPLSHHAVLGYSDEVLWNMLIGICVAVHLIGVSHVIRHVKIREDAFAVMAIRWIAGASFSIYAVHYPTLHLLDAALSEHLPGRDAVLLAITLGICVAFAALFERPIGFYRRVARGAYFATGTPPIATPKAAVR